MQENVWQLQEAKAKFSAFVRAAERYPQLVTVHGQKRVMMVSWPLFKKLAASLEETTEEKIEEEVGQMQHKRKKHKARETLRVFIANGGNAPFSLTISKLVRIKKILCNEL